MFGRLLTLYVLWHTGKGYLAHRRRRARWLATMDAGPWMWVDLDGNRRWDNPNDSWRAWMR